MAVTVLETWTGSDGSAWPSSTFSSTSTATGGVLDIQSNGGRALAGTGASYAAFSSATVDSALTTADFDMTVDVNIGAIVEKYVYFGFRGDGSAAASLPVHSNSWALRLEPSFNLIGIQRYDAGVATVIQTASYTFSASDNVHLRIRAEGSSIAAKVWTGSATEPAGWNLTTGSSTYASQTQGFLGVRGGSSAGTPTVTFDNYIFDTQPRYVPGDWVQFLGQGQTDTAATTTTVSFSEESLKPKQGDLLVVYCSRDNINNDPATGDSIADDAGNTYTRVALAQPAGTSTANAGIVGVLFYTVVTIPWSTGTINTIWTHPSTKAAMRIEHYRMISGLRASGTNTAASSAGAPSVALTTPITADLVVGMEAIEYSTAGTSTADTDTTNGSWSQLGGPVASTGTTLAAVKVINQRKWVTASGTQTYNPTHSVTTNVDCVAIIAAFVPATFPPKAGYYYKTAHVRSVVR